MIKEGFRKFSRLYAADFTLLTDYLLKLLNTDENYLTMITLTIVLRLYGRVSCVVGQLEKSISPALKMVRDGSLKKLYHVLSYNTAKYTCCSSLSF